MNNRIFIITFTFFLGVFVFHSGLDIPHGHYMWMYACVKNHPRTIQPILIGLEHVGHHIRCIFIKG